MSCEYCSYMVVGDSNYCEIKKKCLKDNTIKTYQCKYFSFNEISAINGNIYKKKAKRVVCEKTNLFDLEVEENE